MDLKSRLPKWQMVKNLPANAGDPRDRGSIPGSGKSPGVGNDNPLQYSYLENSLDKGACRLQSMGSQSQIPLSKHTHTHTHTHRS